MKEVFAMAAPSGGEASPLTMLFPWIMILVIFYLIVFRPQRVKQKELERKISELEKGDKVVTSGGLLGIVVGLKEKSVTVKLSDNVKVELLRSSVSSVEKAKKEKG